MMQIAEYVAAGVLASQLGAVVVGLHHRLRDEAGVAFPRWADVANLVASQLAAIGAAAGAGYLLGGAEAAVWGGCGGIVGPQLWPSVRRATVAAIKRRGEGA
jgi:hypothetical protein